MLQDYHDIVRHNTIPTPDLTLSASMMDFLKEDAAIRIQAVYRGYRSRKRWVLVFVLCGIACGLPDEVQTPNDNMVLVGWVLVGLMWMCGRGVTFLIIVDFASQILVFFCFGLLVLLSLLLLLKVGPGMVSVLFVNIIIVE